MFLSGEICQDAADLPDKRIRLEEGASVLAAARAAGVRRYLVQSIAFWLKWSAVYWKRQI